MGEKTGGSANETDQVVGGLLDEGLAALGVDPGDGPEGPEEPTAGPLGAAMISHGIGHPDSLDAESIASIAHTRQAPDGISQPEWRRFRGIAIATLAAAALLVVGGIIVLRPGSTTSSAEAPAAALPAGGAGGNAPGDAANDQAAPGDGAADQAGGGAAQPAEAQPARAVIPTSCLVPQGGALDLELADVTWKEATDGLSFSWHVLIHNRGSDTFSVFLHDVAGANAASRAQSGVGPTEWQASGGNIIEPDGKALPNGDALPIDSESGGGQTSVEPGLPTFCSWEYVDRMVAVYSGPECRDALWAQLKAAPDAAAREALLGPLAIDMPIPDQMRIFACPE
jgi:hypothetical protein